MSKVRHRLVWPTWERATQNFPQRRTCPSSWEAGKVVQEAASSCLFFFALEFASTAEVPHWGGDFTGLAAISGDWLSKA